MKEMTLNTSALPETLFQLIKTDKVTLRESQGEIRLIPVFESAQKSISAANIQRAALRQFREGISACAEEVPEFERVQFTREVDLL